MTAATDHPNDQTLQSYGLGKLKDASSQLVSKHLEACDTCQRRVAEISSDSFLGRLRDFKGSPDPLGPVGSSLAGLSMLDAARVRRHPLRRARCHRDWPSIPTTRSSGSLATGEWGRSTSPIIA